MIQILFSNSFSSYQEPYLFILAESSGFILVYIFYSLFIGGFLYPCYQPNTQHEHTQMSINIKNV